ncbi:TMEM143 family protein [Neptunomonas japonica]|uniref:TMEM143 family protein n=1 Tax=Neptunomonas japonica TaxID=417574 RepID=UPI0003F747B9|nr:TMEM143 family protein [Neptunomonas japonica]
MQKHSIDPLRFIPFRKNDVIEMCLSTGDLDQEQRQKFRQMASMIQKLFHISFQTRLESLKDSFSKINPDSDTIKVDLPSTMHHDDPAFIKQLESLLDKANYEKITEQTLKQALCHDSLVKVRLHVDFSDFAEVLLFARGERETEETVSSFFGLRKTKVRFVNYDRVAIYIRFNEQIDSKRQKEFNLQPGGMVLKLFKNVPKADLEMLFPNTEIKMRLVDKLLIGVPAVISGGIVLTTKLGASILLLASLFAFWLGLKSQPVELDQAALVVIFAGFGAVGSYLWKQFNNFKNRKLRFIQTLTQHLYFKNLDNNAGVFHRLIDAAEEEECKEAFFAYYFLLQANTPLNRQELDQKIERWLSEKWQQKVDFDITDALEKLEALELIEIINDQRLVALPLDAAQKVLLKAWQQLGAQSIS